MKSVTDMLRWQVETKQRFVSVEEGWSRFLHYLGDRNGSDIGGAHRCEEIDAHLECVESLIDDPDASRDEDKAMRLLEFGRRADVIEAFHKFAARERLSFA